MDGPRPLGFRDAIVVSEAICDCRDVVNKYI